MITDANRLMEADVRQRKGVAGMWTTGRSSTIPAVVSRPTVTKWNPANATFWLITKVWRCERRNRHVGMGQCLLSSFVLSTRRFFMLFFEVRCQLGAITADPMTDWANKATFILH